MDIQLSPRLLSGTIMVPSSKSISHRMLICAALSSGKSQLQGITLSQDIQATISILKNMGAAIEIDNCLSRISVKGITCPPSSCTADCGESGSTLRFLIPITAALGISATFLGAGKLPQRPVTPYYRELEKKGIQFNCKNTMPFTITGKLLPGTFYMEGNISSQFITGLLLALPLLPEDSQIVLTSPLESKPYVDITINCLKQFGITVIETELGYKIPGRQSYQACDCQVEGDYSQAAFFLTANALGSHIDIQNLSAESLQGDKEILAIIQKMGYNKNNPYTLNHFIVDISNIPDLAPILAVLGCFGTKPSQILNGARLRMKESDRLTAIMDMLEQLGGNADLKHDALTVYPVSSLNGGAVDSYNDHRIVMAASIASTRCKNPVIIKNAEAVKKSYPTFFDDFQSLGGFADVVNLET